MLAQALNKIADEKEKLLEQLREIKYNNVIENFKPYPYQVVFLEASAEFRDLNLMAGNRVGKTRLAAYMMACHLTGNYPPFWDQLTTLRFDFPITAWGLGVSNEQLHDVMQKHLFGNLDEKSNTFTPDATVEPFLPAKYILGVERNAQMKGLVKNVYIKHVSGGKSLISLKGYEQKQAKLMGSVVDYAWVDEEPIDQKIIPQVITRLTDGHRGRGGTLVFTFTPENGMTQRVAQLLKTRSHYQYLQRVTWDDAPHLTEERKKEILALIPEYQRKMRSQGIPIRGTGVVFPYDENDYKFTSRQFPHGFPAHWPKLIGIDFGWDHPQGWVWICWDRDNDVIYLYKCLRQRHTTSAQMAGRLYSNKEIWMPVAWPHDGHQHEKGKGVELAAQYKKDGINMLYEHATFDEGGYSVEAGIMDIVTRIEEGRLKVHESCTQFFEEMMNYHREDGKIIKIDDDLIDAYRAASMMKRHAKLHPEMMSETRRRTTGRKKRSWF